ncbi:MAG: phenylphosphate carboxylase subunit beta [Chloroflexi bacterium]|nr:phenylphosphate carboxylase subunit beta [Chloroflexota bacterium]
MDLRLFIEQCESIGELKRVKAEVDWNLELSHVSKLVEEKKGPALLFENITGYKTPVFTGAFATPSRLALSLGMPSHLSMCEAARQWMKTTVKTVIPAQEVKSGPVQENVVDGDDVNLAMFPAPRFYPLDGGRYIGTTVFLVIQDPESGDHNLGTYRMQMLDEKHCGVQILPGKRGERILKKYKKMGKKMPAAAVIGADPLLFLAGTLMHAGTSEYDLAGSLRGAPTEIVKAELTGLPVPASAEIVLEGEIDPENFRAEGPFGEYTGYYTDELGKEIKKPCLAVKRIMHRNNPILWATSVGRPVADSHMILAFTRTATLWTDLEQMKIPGIQSVYVLPEAAGRFWAIVSVKQMYPGHSAHVANAVISTTTGSYGIKGVIVVDDDISADDIQRVLWALSVRYDPMRGTQLIQRGRSTPLDPALDPNSNKLITSRILLDATIPYEWEKKPTEIRLDEETFKKVKARWSEYGID